MSKGEDIHECVHGVPYRYACEVCDRRAASGAAHGTAASAGLFDADDLAEIARHHGPASDHYQRAVEANRRFADVVRQLPRERAA